MKKDQFRCNVPARFARLEAVTVLAWVEGKNSEEKLKKYFWVVEVNLDYNFSTKLSDILTPILLIEIFRLSFYVMFPDFSKPLLQASVYTATSPRLAAGRLRDATQMEFLY